MSFKESLKNPDTDVQFIGADIGRGFIDGYSVYNSVRECAIKSIVAEGRTVDTTDYKNPIHISVESQNEEFPNGEEYFVGELAEKEGDNITPNSSDSKTSITAQKLLYALLNEIAVASKVKINIGVPKKSYNKRTLQEVKDTYKDKTVVIKDKITGSMKSITIADVMISRESEAALRYCIATHPDRAELAKKRCGMVTVGFRTTEPCYFDKGMKYIDKYSETKELGNRTVLSKVRKELEKKDIIKDLHVIDSETDYDDLKEKSYPSLIEAIDQRIEADWTDWPEMKIFLGGGTAEKFKNLKEKYTKYELVSDPRMVTAKGLNYIAERSMK